jgi:hypothetical protein
MPQQNPFFEQATQVGEELFKVKKEGETVPAIEFGMQEASRSQWRNAVMTNKTFAKKEWKRMGRQKFARTFGDNRSKR